MILIIFNFSCAPICLVIFSISKANVLQDFIEIIGYAPMIHLIIKENNDHTINQIKSYLQQECAKNNILHFGVFHPSFAHTKDDIDYTIKVYDKVFSMLNNSAFFNKQPLRKFSRISTLWKGMFNLGVGFGLVKQLTYNNRNNMSQRGFIL